MKTLAPEKARERNSSSLTIGARARRSHSDEAGKQRQRPRPATANGETPRALSGRPKLVRPQAISAEAGGRQQRSRNIELAPFGRPVARHAPAEKAEREQPIGTLMAKISRHIQSAPNDSTMPPMNGPIAVVSDENAAQRPIALPRVSGG